jgi:ribosomal protein L37AE/L43A
MRNYLPEDFYKQFKNVEIKRGIKCNTCKEVASEYNLVNHFCPKCDRQEFRKISATDDKQYKCPECRIAFEEKDSKKIFFCNKCNMSSDKSINNFSRHVEVDLFELMGLDLVLVSPRHLFRMPYSLHEKTALASIVVDPDKIEDFDITDANPLKVKVKSFMPQAIPGESSELIREALDWAKENQLRLGEPDEKIKGKYADFKPITLKNIQDSQFPPCVVNILKGLRDGKKRAVFILVNFFRSIGMDKEELEKRIFEWNEKNELPLKKGYIISQLFISYKRKPLMPPNCKEYYQGIAVCVPDEFCQSSKNPVNYVVKRNYFDNNKKKNNKFKKKE